MQHTKPVAPKAKSAKLGLLYTPAMTTSPIRKGKEKRSLYLRKAVCQSGSEREKGKGMVNCRCASHGIRQSPKK